MTTGKEPSLLVQAQDLLAGGPDVLERLPTPDELSELEAPERHAFLSRMRLELYGLASIVADGAVERARRDRSLYPPYGLARSMFSQLRMVVDSPLPYELGSIDGYPALGRAVLDTVVFHLDRELAEYRASERAWLVGRLAHLLALYRSDAVPAARARMRDELSFIYGGLHFGTSVCVQMVEVMSRLLDQSVGSPVLDKATVIARSIRAPYQLAAINIDDVPLAYQHLLAGPEGPAGWMGSGHFTVQAQDGTPLRVDLRPDHLPAIVAGAGQPRTYATYGCPARISPSGGPSAIAVLWNWCIELAETNKLL